MEMERNMLDADATTGNGQYLEGSDHQSAAQELEEALSLRLPVFHRHALRLLGNPADAEDAVQEAMLSALKHIEDFRGQSQITTWLTAIVRNSALMQLRRKSRQIHVPLDEQMGDEQPYFAWQRLAHKGPSPEDECRRSEFIARLRECTARLSPSLRTTFELRTMDELSIFETARVLGLPEGTVKARLARARAKLARYMKPVLDRI